MDALSNHIFKRILVLFWGFWWLIAFLTDLLGGLKHLKLIHWDLNVDGNYPFLVKSLAQFHTPEWIPASLFVMIIVWLFVATFLFFRASFASREEFYAKANTAFVVSLCLWLAFFISDQIIMNFDLEANHMVQGSFGLLSFLALRLL